MSDNLKRGQIVAGMSYTEPPTLTDILGKFKGKTALQVGLMLGTQFRDGIIAVQRDFLHLPEPAHHTTHLWQIKGLSPDMVILVNQRERYKTEYIVRNYFTVQCQGDQPRYAVFDLPVEPDSRFFEAADERDNQLMGVKKKGFWKRFKSGLYDLGAIVGMALGAMFGQRPNWFDAKGLEVCSTAIASRTQCGYLAMGLPADTLRPGTPNTADYYPGYVWELKRVVVI